jgi:hypothetical protein
MACQEPWLQHPKPIHPIGPLFDSTQIPVLDWLRGNWPYSERRCRSADNLECKTSEPVHRKESKSAPEMASWEGFRVPPIPTPPPTRQRAGSITSESDSSRRSHAKNPVEDPNYREFNLNHNGISLRSHFDSVPDDIADLMKRIRSDRQSPGPVHGDAFCRELESIANVAAESEVEDFYRKHVFPGYTRAERLKLSDRIPMVSNAVPNPNLRYRVSKPVPDLLYGYTRAAFQNQEALATLGTDALANSQNLLFPFLLVEIKGDGSGSTGSLQVATNQCLGGSAACVNLVNRLNQLLQEDCGIGPIMDVPTAVFSIAMSNSEARIYISWKYDRCAYYMVPFKNILLSTFEGFSEFRKYVRNIIDWSANARLPAIQKALDLHLEVHDRKRETMQRSSSPGGSSSSKRQKHSERVHGRSYGSDGAESSFTSSFFLIGKQVAKVRIIQALGCPK